MNAFINSTCAISPQKTFGSKGFPDEIIEYKGVQYLKCLEPTYNEYLDPMASRRMSRIVKMGVCAALKCLRDAGIENPDAIITGTGLGCIEDTEKFLASIYENEEKLLNPTPFIQSTHNTVAAAIALNLKCRNYNSTYVHRGFSFESALLDGLMLLKEGTAKNILVGGIDELTNNSFTITGRLGFWKRQPIDILNLLNTNTRGSIAGEGTTFFSVSSTRNERSMAEIKSVETFYKPENISVTEEKITDFVQRTCSSMNNLDLVILGINGDSGDDKIYYMLKDHLFNAVPCVYYKHMCGESDSSSAFALWLASMILNKGNVPEVLRIDNKAVRKIENILIYNHLRNTNHSMFLISSC
jgi:3-oxoacyl-[acyl-carrier-protein] synthase II